MAYSMISITCYGDRKKIEGPVVEVLHLETEICLLVQFAFSMSAFFSAGHSMPNFDTA